MSPRFLVSRCACLSFCCCAAFALVAGMAAARGAEAPAKRGAAAQAPQLVQAALDAELAGNAQQRSALLAEATAADPEFAPARWAVGQLKFDGEWRTPAQVANLVTYHHRWTDYRKLRDSLSGSPADHEQLAIWCHDNGLANEERYHWANVLMASPGHTLARERLGLEAYRGGLFTHEQVAQFEKRAKEANATADRLKPKFTKLCRDAATSEGTLRTAALEELSAVSDPAAIEALEAAVNRQSAKTSRAALDLNLALVAALSNIPQPEATLRLVNYAVFNPHEQVRTLAAMSLKKRPQTDYVPLLMAAIKAPVELDIDVLTAPDGTVRMTETLHQKGADADVEHTRSVNFETEGAITRDPARENPAAVLANHLSRAAAIARDAQQRTEATNARARELNDRIETALQIAADFHLESDRAEDWWNAWQDYNELQSASEQLVVESHDEANFVYTYFQRPPEVAVAWQPEVRRGPRSCFKAGTAVWTQAGPAAIETVRIGDMVLSQHPETGELAYRPVLLTTVGQPTTVVRLQLPSEAIVATLGHRFWVNGRGWEMTKFLAPANQLHTLNGATEIVSMAPEAEKVEAYNLIVDEFHTYFVGDSKLLVHDNGCPLPVIVAVPGSATVRASWSPRNVP